MPCPGLEPRTDALTTIASLILMYGTQMWNLFGLKDNRNNLQGVMIKSPDTLLCFVNALMQAGLFKITSRCCIDTISATLSSAAKFDGLDQGRHW